MLRIGYELGTSHASSWAPLMLRVGHLSCFDLGTFDARVGHLSCLELGMSWAPLML